MVTKFYVGNLSWNATEQEVENFFTKFGKVTAVKLITDRDTGRPKGFGFVEIETDNAQPVFDASGEQFMGRAIVINKATEKKPSYRG